MLIGFINNDIIIKLINCRAWNSIRVLREITAKLVKHDRSPYQMNVVLLRYALHNLCFDNITPYQLKLSLAAACGHADLIKKKFEKEEAQLFVYWLNNNDLKTKGKLGITLIPGRKDRGRNLDNDLQTLKSYGVSRLVCLSQNTELEELGVSNLSSKTINYGIQYLAAPIKDQSIPSLSRLYEIIDWIIEGLKLGENIVICCTAGLGRSGTIASCVLAICGK